MKLVSLLSCISAASATIYFKETFDEGKAAVIVAPSPLPLPLSPVLQHLHYTADAVYEAISPLLSPLIVHVLSISSILSISVLYLSLLTPLMLRGGGISNNYQMKKLVSLFRVSIHSYMNVTI
jgi:hypothetical protein